MADGDLRCRYLFNLLRYEIGSSSNAIPAQIFKMPAQSLFKESRIENELFLYISIFELSFYSEIIEEY
jgi:hypothetical protein